MSSVAECKYVGNELEIFAHAVNWKSYVRAKIQRFLRGQVLEVGAGIGTGTQEFYDGTQERWVCLEPDPNLAQQIPVKSFPNSDRCEVRVGTLAELGDGEFFDCIVYMDVLEHIEDDRGEAKRAVQHLKQEGYLVILSPALPYLYTQFDHAIGHFRRYGKRSLRAIAPQGVKEETCVYLDCVGALTSLGNRMLLHSSSPRRYQILLWDRVLVPISRVADMAIGHSVGRSILIVWKRS
jgi:SAM-dependent methyltransferase